MTNLTEFICQKIKRKAQQNFPSYDKNNGYIQKKQQAHQNQNSSRLDPFSEKSIGLTTLLDLQNDEQFLQTLEISKIGSRGKQFQNRKQHLKKSSHLTKGFSITNHPKTDIEQMRQKRQKLDKKISRTLKMQGNIENYIYSPQDIKSSLDLQKRTDSKSSLFSQSIKISQKSCQNSSISQQIVQSSHNSQGSHIDQVNDHKSTHNSKPEPEQSFNSSQKSSLSHLSKCQIQRIYQNRPKDSFLSYLEKQIILLKCQKFVQFLKRFKYKWMMKVLNVRGQLIKIQQRNDRRLCQFVFIEWKRHSNAEGRRNSMVQMMRKKVLQKIQNLNLKQSLQKQLLIPQKIDLLKQHKEQNQLAEQCLGTQLEGEVEFYVRENKSKQKNSHEKDQIQCIHYEKEFNLQQISPIKNYPNQSPTNQKEKGQQKIKFTTYPKKATTWTTVASPSPRINDSHLSLLD